MRARARVGPDDGLDRRGRTPGRGPCRPRALGRRRRQRVPARPPRTTAASCCATTCCGSSRTCASSTRGCSRRPTRCVRRRRPCITCSDEGTLAEVVTVDAAGAASVRTAAGIEPIDVTLVAPVAPGDLVLVHAGTAIALVETARRSGSSTAMSERHRLPVPVHRRRRARRRRAARATSRRRPSARAP